MNRQIPGLRPDELERLAILAEELAEAGQVIGKILRHGYKSCHPNGGPNNRELLEEELGHVEWAIDFLRVNGDVHADAINDAYDEKLSRVEKYLHHNLTTGMFIKGEPQ